MDKYELSAKIYTEGKSGGEGEVLRISALTSRYLENTFRKSISQYPHRKQPRTARFTSNSIPIHDMPHDIPDK